MKVNVYNPKLFGPIRFDSMSDFILQTYAASGLMEKNGDPFGINKDSPSSGTTNAAVDLQTTESEEEWKSNCGPEFRGLCAILFVNGKDQSSDGLGNKFLDIARAMGANAAAFKFLLIDGACQTTFADSFDIQDSKLPTVVAYSPSKDRYALVKSAYSDSSAVKDFLIAVASGKMSTQPMSVRPTFKSECEVVEEYIESASEDAGDFLEEIRKEEEERAKRLAKEVEEERKRLLEEKASKANADANSKKKKKKKSNKSKESKKSEL
jgi:hypothetical protein